MPFHFRCPSCEADLKTPTKLIGAEIRCPNCEVKIEVPDPRAGENEEGGARTSANEPLAKEAPLSLGKGRDREEAEMDMTPMVDVTFLLLIFFMVTAAFSLQKALDTPPPKEDKPSTQATETPPPEEDPNVVVVKVDANNTYYVIADEWEEEAPSKQELLIKLREARTGNTNGVIPDTLVVMANAEAFHEKVVDALDAGQAVGMNRIKLTTVEGEEM